MLVSRANLEVVKVTSNDAFDQGLFGVRFEADGSSVAGNTRMLVAVGPVVAKVYFPDSVADDFMISESEGLIMPKDSVVRALRLLERGPKNQHLQHVKLSQMVDDNRVGFTSLNAKGDPTTNAALPVHQPFPDWRAQIRDVRGPEEGVTRVCLNRKDLILLLETLERACPDKGKISPVFLEIGADGKGIVARCRNLVTGQDAIGVMMTYKLGDGKWMPLSRWEKVVFAVRRRIRKGKR